MSIWVCRPALSRDLHNYRRKAYDDVAYIDRGIPIDLNVKIDTDNIQESLYNAFHESGWIDGERMMVKDTDYFSYMEFEEYFDIYINNRLMATFWKEQELISQNPFANLHPAEIPTEIRKYKYKRYGEE